MNRTWSEILRWKLSAKPATWPRHIDDPRQPPPPTPTAGITATWIGHSSFLLRTPSTTLLVDPVWSRCAGPLGQFGPPRVRAPALPLHEVPPLDAVLLTHDHYDHCDLPTLRRLAVLHPSARLIAPLGCEDIARRTGFEGRASLLDWWDTAQLGDGVEVTATPARHWSNRIRGARNSRLWCGWHVCTPEATCLHVGDTAYDDTFFHAIRAHLGPPDLALVPIGAYAPRWFMAAQHCDPAEAVRIHQDLGAHRSFGMHWGTFQLTDEAFDEPPREVARCAAAAGLRDDEFTTGIPGTTVGTTPRR